MQGVPKKKERKIGEAPLPTDKMETKPCQTVVKRDTEGHRVSNHAICSRDPRVQIARSAWLATERKVRVCPTTRWATVIRNSHFLKARQARKAALSGSAVERARCQIQNSRKGLAATPNSGRKFLSCCAPFQGFLCFFSFFASHRLLGRFPQQQIGETLRVASVRLGPDPVLGGAEAGSSRENTGRPLPFLKSSA